MLGINGPEFILLALIALLVVGPERLPQYATQLGRLVREARRMATGAREQVRAELGPEFDDIDWQKLDPRQYDPRRIVREALTEAWDDDAHPGGGRDSGATAVQPAGGRATSAGDSASADRKPAGERQSAADRQLAVDPQAAAATKATATVAGAHRAGAHKAAATKAPATRASSPAPFDTEAT